MAMPSDAHVRPRRVFISYAHESDEHVRLVRELWIFLRQRGVDAQLDLLAAQRRQDWSLWMADQVREADHVLIVASAAYRKRAEGRSGLDGRGVQYEARLIRAAFYRDQRELDRFVPVVLPGQSVDGVPDFLAPETSTVYHVREFTDAGTDALLRLLTNRPAVTEPPLGPPRPAPHPVITPLTGKLPLVRLGPKDFVPLFFDPTRTPEYRSVMDAQERVLKAWREATARLPPVRKPRSIKAEAEILAAAANDPRWLTLGKNVQHLCRITSTMDPITTSTGHPGTKGRKPTPDGAAEYVVRADETCTQIRSLLARWPGPASEA